MIIPNTVTVDVWDTCAAAGAILVFVGVAALSLPGAISLAGIGLAAFGVYGAAKYGTSTPSTPKE